MLNLLRLVHQLGSSHQVDLILGFFVGLANQSGNTGASAGGGFGDGADNCCEPRAVGRLLAGWSNAAAAGRLRITLFAVGLTILTIASTDLDDGNAVTVMTRTKVDTEMWVTL